MSNKDLIIPIPGDELISITAPEPDIWKVKAPNQRLVNRLARPVFDEIRNRHEQALEDAKPKRWKI